MKKYSIYDLRVVRIKKDSGYYSFICRRGFDSYVEVLTGEKIKADDENDVLLLAEYYPVLARRNYSTGVPLIVDKKDILRKYIEINSENCLEEVEEACNENCSDCPDDTSIIDKILDEATDLFFPTTGIWYASCFKRPKIFSMYSLPCNLRDDEWLARMMKIERKLFFLSYNRILKYVKSSPHFEEKRHNYELEIVRWQIEWMINGGDGWVGDDFALLCSNCDIFFRKGIVDTLTQIGMSRNAIEEGIEKYANMWRDALMKRAFNNEYTNVFAFEENDGLSPLEDEHRDKWIKLRKYDYYQKHKDSVNIYGVVEHDMIMLSDEVNELRTYVNKKHNERKQEMHQKVKIKTNKVTE